MSAEMTQTAAPRPQSGADIRRPPVVIHLGLQKTGSTAFQNFMSRNRHVLNNDLISVLPQDRGQGAAIGRQAMRFSETRNPEDLAALKTTFEQIAEGMREAGKQLLVSNENILGAAMGRGQVRSLYPALEQIIAVIDAVFAPDLPTYTLCLREELAWKRSLHNQVVRTDLYAGTFEAFLMETEPCEGWGPLIARIEAVVGSERLSVIDIADEPEPHRFPGRQILDRLGLEVARIATLAPNAERHNESLSEGALEFLRQVNALDLSSKARRQVGKLVQRNSALFADTTSDPKEV